MRATHWPTMRVVFEILKFQINWYKSIHKIRASMRRVTLDWAVRRDHELGQKCDHTSYNTNYQPGNITCPKIDRIHVTLATSESSGVMSGILILPVASVS